MYTITEVLVVQLLAFVIIFNSQELINYFDKKIPFFYNDFSEKINGIIRFYKFICENNPLLLDYLDETDELPVLEDIKEDNKNEKSDTLNHESCKLVKYEDKYLEKFKKFPNEFCFNEFELDEERNEYEKIKLDYEKRRLDTINILQERLFRINEIQEKGDISNVSEHFTETINDFGINSLLKFFDITEEYKENPYDFVIEKLYKDLLENKVELLKKMYETEKMVMTDDEMHLKAREFIINNKLDKYIDNYVLEHTPLGNIYMRYNNDKKSFEYFSNSTIPYRYLESVGRKYVTTYWCKPIFVDIEEELKKSEERYDEEKKKKDEEEKMKEEDRKKNPKKFLAQLKNYNKETKGQAMTAMKNRSHKNSILPPQIHANLPDVNKTSDKQLLKEKANRYTWEGRLTNFSPLKKVDRKNLDNSLSMTYADFKKLNQERQKLILKNYR